MYAMIQAMVLVCDTFTTIDINKDFKKPICRMMSLVVLFSYQMEFNMLTSKRIVRILSR